MNSKLLGGILLVVGTSIGAGMLALPVATAELGFWGSVFLLVGCWALMTASAFLFLEVNLWLPPNTNLISMAGATLGWGGQAMAWISYLGLLYCILAAYIAGGGDLFHFLLHSNGMPISESSSALLFTFIFGLVVYFGIRVVDYVNRGLMFGKMGSYLLLVLFILPFIHLGNLGEGSFKNIMVPNSITITVLSFASLMIVPSLRTYFESDIKGLRKAIFYGSLIPLLCYIAWDLVIMGVVPLGGDQGLKSILKSNNSNSELVTAVSTLLNKDSITLLVKFFTSICMATSFLSIALCLSDFLSDGLRIPKEGLKGNGVIYAVTFLPPLSVVLFIPNAFLLGLNYAGVCSIVLMLLLPPLMVWSGRYRKGMAQASYQVGGGKFLVAILIVFATLIVGFGISGLF